MQAYVSLSRIMKQTNIPNGLLYKWVRGYKYIDVAFPNLKIGYVTGNLSEYHYLEADWILIQIPRDRFLKTRFIVSIWNLTRACSFQHLPSFKRLKNKDKVEKIRDHFINSSSLSTEDRQQIVRLWS